MHIQIQFQLLKCVFSCILFDVSVHVMFFTTAIPSSISCGVCIAVVTPAVVAAVVVVVAVAVVVGAGLPSVYAKSATHHHLTHTHLHTHAPTHTRKRTNECVVLMLFFTFLLFAFLERLHVGVLPFEYTHHTSLITQYLY